MKKSGDRIAKGVQGESAVAQMLVHQGFAVVARNFRQPFGEVDIIAQKERLLIFVEVKLRTSDRVDPAELIVLHKQKKIIAVAKAFLSCYTQGYDDCVCRFDVALVTFNDQLPVIQYVQNAFFENE